MAVCSAPGRICLFGEHAILYGEPAVACAINLRAKVEAEESRSIRIDGKSRYVVEAVRKMREIAGFRGVSLKITSEIPPQSGLGSSAAVTVAALAAMNEEFHAGLSTDEIASIGWEIERRVQGRASRMDTLTSSLGGILCFPEGKKLRPMQKELIIGNSLTPSSTRREVEKVAKLHSEHPEVVGKIMSGIGEISREGIKNIRRRNYRRIGELMNLNQLLLSLLGVSSPAIENLLDAVKDESYGAKITGAGGGGCIIVLPKNPEVVGRKIRKAGGIPYRTRISEKGILSL
jgi:mevalonate kinase